MQFKGYLRESVFVLFFASVMSKYIFKFKLVLKSLIMHLIIFTHRTHHIAPDFSQDRDRRVVSKWEKKVSIFFLKSLNYLKK